VYLGLTRIVLNSRFDASAFFGYESSAQIQLIVIIEVPSLFGSDAPIFSVYRGIIIISPSIIFRLYDHPGLCMQRQLLTGL